MVKMPMRDLNWKFVCDDFLLFNYMPIEFKIICLRLQSTGIEYIL